MRWKAKRRKKHLEIKIIKKYLFLPLRINNEIRWLEYAIIKARWYSPIGIFAITPHWDYLEFLDKP